MQRLINFAMSTTMMLVAATYTHAANVDVKSINKIIDDAIAEWRVPGSCVVIVDGDKILYLGGRGLREAGKPERMTADTVFPLASCGKAFTTTLLAMLADDRKLAWDDPVRKHLKDFHLADPLADGDVRLRDLVSHRTGVASHDLLWYRASWDQDEMIRRIGLVPLSQPFRSGMQYQSIMFMAGGKAAANAAGKSWESQIQERILQPLRMTNASLTSTAALKNADHASPHQWNGEALKVLLWYDMPQPNSAGSVNASARDLVPWLQLHLNEGMQGDRCLVSAANLAETHSPQIVIPMDASIKATHPFSQQMSYGMAWVVQDYRGELLVSHAGLIDGFRAHLTLLPKRKLALAVLCNLDQTRLNLALSNTLVDRLLDAPAYDWNDHYSKIVKAEEFNAKIKAVQLERNRKRNTKPSLPLESYAGRYEEPAYGTATVKFENGELTLEWSSFQGKLRHYQDDVFRADDEELGRQLVQFHAGEKGVAAMSAVGMRFKKN